MKNKHLIAFTFVCLSAVPFNRAGADPAATDGASAALSAAALLGQRLHDFGIHAQTLFYTPTVERIADEKELLLEERFLDVGVASYWRQYSTDEEIHADDYKGYILFGDPYHEGLKRISFLLGSDCSHFVQRLFQMLGAEYPYAKTRHFIHLGKAATQSQSIADYIAEQKKQGVPFDQKLCFFENLEKKFELVKDSPESRAAGTLWKVGDVLVFPKSEGIVGERGHMGLLVRTAPLTLLHAHNSKEGIVETSFKPDGPEEYYHFRWRAEVSLAAIPADVQTLDQLLARHYERAISFPCGQTND